MHAPGRPHDPVAAKALAIAAAKCFANFHPNGMKVNAGSVVLEPGLTQGDFAEMARDGVRHAKYGFGGYAHPLYKWRARNPNGAEARLDGDVPQRRQLDPGLEPHLA